MTLALFAFLCQCFEIGTQNRNQLTERIMGFHVYGKVAVLSCIAITISLSATQVRSGPDDTTKHFMNDSVSMLDWGILKITKFTLDGQNGNPVGYASYNYDSDRIYIRGLARTDDDLDADGFQELCRVWIDDVRGAGLVDKKSGIPYINGHSYFATLFSHEGFVRGNSEDETKRLRELDKKFHLEYFIRRTDLSLRYVCNAPLLGTGFASESFE